MPCIPSITLVCIFYGIALSPMPPLWYPLTQGDYLCCSSSHLWGSHIYWWENRLQRLPCWLSCQLPCQAGDVSCIVLTWGDQSTNQEEGTNTWKPEKIAVNLFPLEKYHSCYHSCSQWFYSQSRFPEGRGEKVKLKTPTQSFPFHVFLAKQKFQQQAPADG